jgi:hypothetical protein
VHLLRPEISYYGLPCGFAAVTLDDEAITYLHETAKLEKKGSAQSKRLQPWQIFGLKTWLNKHFDHPYPSPHEKQALCEEFKLTKQQVGEHKPLRWPEKNIRAAFVCGVARLDDVMV